MKQKILNVVMTVSAIIMILDILFCYGVPEGRVVMVVSALVCSIAYIISDYLEDKEEA